MSRPALTSLLRANAAVIWTWLVAVGLSFAVPLREGLGQPSQGLALSAAAIPALLVALTPLRHRRWVMLLTVGVLCVLALANAAYYRIFGVYLPLQAVDSLRQGWEVRGYLGSILGADDVVPVLLVVISGLAAVARRPGPLLSRRWSITLPVIVCLLGSTPALAWAWVVGPGAADTATGGFLYAHLMDVRTLVGEWRSLGTEPSLQEMARVRQFLDGRRAEEGAADPWYGHAAGSNLVIIQVEALNAWLLDADVDGEPVMPFVRALRGRALSFTGVFDQTHEGRSSDADYLVMASQHPLPRGAVSMTLPSLDPVGLADVLDRAGYTTLSAHAHHPGFWNAAIRHRAYGFGASLFAHELGDGPRLGFGLLDSVFLARTAPRVVALPPPWAAWLITLTMHGPHGPVPPALHTLRLGALEGTPLGNYYLKARHTDHAIRSFLAHLERGGALDNATVVIYGDHTESYRFDMSVVDSIAGVTGLPADARHLLLDRVALLIVPPDGSAAAGAYTEVGTTAASPTAGAPATSFPAVGGLIDVAPTLLDLLGLPVPRSYVGRSLLHGPTGVSAQVTGEAVGHGLMWTGKRCFNFPSAEKRPSAACDGMRAEAREELDVSGTITRHGLSAVLDGGTN